MLEAVLWKEKETFNPNVRYLKPYMRYCKRCVRRPPLKLGPGDKLFGQFTIRHCCAPYVSGALDYEKDMDYDLV